MSEFVRIARQSVRGLPYLQKELARRISLRTGKVLATPVTYYVIFSGRCNLACPFCTIHTAVDPTLSKEVMLRIVREAQALSGRGFNISLSGGEPTIYPPLYDALELAHQLGVNFGFTTNGLALTKSNVQRIVAHDPFNINVSIESVHPETNEALRPFRDGTKRALEGIQFLLEEKERTGARLGITVKPTIMEQNYRTLPDLVRHFGRPAKVQVNFQPYVGPAGAPYWIKDLKDLGRVLEELKALQREGYPIIGSPDVFEGFLTYFTHPPCTGEHYSYLDLQGAKRNCDIGLRSMFIYPNGDVAFCDFLNQPIGNVNGQSLSEIYYGEIASRQRRRMVYCNIDCQQTCKRPTPLLVKARAFLRMG
jgi:MoaA/NifB/PqqE/SkfB family radical SAM enzyme